jgi:hypothetical protein
MPNPACEKCKPDKPEQHDALVDRTGCAIQYDKVKMCMRKYAGNVSDCDAEWTSFRA